MFYSDYHIHSKFSSDSQEDLDKIITTAIGLGLKEIVITDHMDHDTNWLPEDYYFDVEKYTTELVRLREKYAKEIDIKIGAELGLQPHTGDFYKKDLEKFPFDFVIASSHDINRIDMGMNILQKGKTRDEMQNLYFQTVLDCVKNFNEFSVYGHLDFVTRYGGPEFRGMNLDNHMEMIEKILKELIHKGKGIEINTSGFRYNEDRVYPQPAILKKYFDLGGEILTIGSDAHKATDIARDFKTAYDILEDLGVKYISSFKEGKPSFIKIR